ncbi:MAG: helix-turn-helix domain-containing protein [Limisphaerales bacterium]
MKNEHELGPLSDAITKAIHELSKVVAQAVGHGLAKGTATSPMPPAPAPPAERTLTKLQVAELFQVSPRTVDVWMSRGYLPHWRLGRSIRFRLRDVQEHLDSHHKVRGHS